LGVNDRTYQAQPLGVKGHLPPQTSIHKRDTKLSCMGPKRRYKPPTVDWYRARQL